MVKYKTKPEMDTAWKKGEYKQDELEELYGHLKVDYPIFKKYLLDTYA